MQLFEKKTKFVVSKILFRNNYRVRAMLQLSVQNIIMMVYGCDTFDGVELEKSDRD